MKLATLQQSKDQLWDAAGVRQSRYPVDPNFYWLTQTCDLLHPTAMHTPHLFNSLKMIWNNTVPEECRIEPFTKYGGLKKWKRKYTQMAIENLLAELMNRNDRTKGMDATLQQMADHLRKWGSRLLPKE